MILIFTNKGDIHCNPVISHLRRMEAAHLRINTESLLSDYDFTFEVDEFGGTDLRIHCHRNGISTRFSEVNAYWDRRPHRPRELHDSAPKEMHSESRRVALEEAAELATWMRLSLTGIHGIGSPLGDQLGECKLHQFVVARRSIHALANSAGIRIPETVISNRRASFLPLLSRHRALAIKPISADGASMSDELELPFLTQRVESEAILSLPEDAFSITPTLMQPYIEKAHELRVTTVSGRTFCCKIMSNEMEDDIGGVDWRAGYVRTGGLPQEAIETPPVIHDFCVEYLRRIGLEFGCFDFIIDRSLTPWFLECNPNGQWMWMEEEVGLPISEAIASSLASGGRD